MGTMFENYENILIGLRDNLPETEVVLVSLTSMSMDWGKNNQLAAYNNVKIKLLAEKYGYEYVDLYSALFDLEKGEIRAEYTTDGGHQTAEGYAVFTRTITPVLEELDCLKKQEE
jgi:lysophospholipase L1-like esterase